MKLVMWWVIKIQAIAVNVMLWVIKIQAMAVRVMWCYKNSCNDSKGYMMSQKDSSNVAKQQ